MISIGSSSLVFLPLVPVWLLWAAGALALVLVALALWRGLAGWALRGLAMAVLVVALAGPSLQHEGRASLSDIVLVLIDRSASAGLAGRPEQTEAALARVRAELGAMENIELREHEIFDAPDDAGTLAMTALAEALAEVPRARIAGAILISDGRVHDLEMTPDLPAPLHVLLTGKAADWDRRLVIRNAPAFAIIGEEFVLRILVEDQGRVPADAGESVTLSITVDAEEAQEYDVPVGVEMDLPVTLPHGGMNVLQFGINETAGELTTRNNSAVVQVNGVRDRLRVLLVSGEPHAGERVWRNLLKSDASVDLVHFTILRPPEKQDDVPVDELSLIAFPTRELFIDKIDEFDLIIFDRYRMRGILPMSYIENVVRYVKEGGTVLVAAGPEYGAVDSLYRSPLAEILPAAPTAQVIDEPFLPTITELGQRHPVTEGLEAFAAPGVDGKPGWGRWLRAIEVEPLAGQIVMEGPRGLPLLVLDRVEEGRVAVLASDHAWLWGRGYEGGGPQLELLRRLAHWMLKEPDLEEETLTATIEGERLSIIRRSIEETPPGPLTITGPDGRALTLEMEQSAAGAWQLDWQAPGPGLYRLRQGDLQRVVGIGPAAPREYAMTIASGAALQAAVAARQGGIMAIEQGLPSLRQVGEGRVAAGRGWIGITPREAHVTTDIRLGPVLPAWGWLLLAAALALGGWLIEGRRAARLS